MTFLKGITMETCVVIDGRIVLIDENGLTRVVVRDYFHPVGCRVFRSNLQDYCISDVGNTHSGIEHQRDKLLISEFRKLSYWNWPGKV